MKVMLQGRGSQNRDGGEQWMSVSDLMSGLMIVFLFVSIVLMRHALVERDKIKTIAVAYQNAQVAIYEALQGEFRDDLERWNAEIDQKTLAFWFRAPDVLFGVGSAELRPVFREVLGDFFPRYMVVLSGFRANIDEVRIEGHTSSDWNTGTPADVAYFRNMELSQNRTRAVLHFVQSLEAMRESQTWIRQNVAAVGYSSGRLVLDVNGTELPDRSRRVTFRVMTNAETQIRRIIEN